MRRHAWEGAWQGRRWLSFSVSAVLLALLAWGALRALEDAEETSERFVVDVTLRNLRSGLQLAMGEAMIEGRENEFASWVGSNPLRWLGTPPGGYVGACPAQAAGLAPGGWCFDETAGELVYRPRHGMRLRLASPVADPADQRLRWRVEATSRLPGGRITGLRVQSVTPYAWD